METLYFDVLQFLYHLALAVIVGGGLVLGSAAAPAIFRTARSRSEAGTIFGGVLGRFDQLAILALVVLVVTSVLKVIAFEDTSLGPRLYLRWAALLVVAGAVLFASAWSNPVARSIRASTPDFDELREDHAARREFRKLHASSTRAMSVAIAAGTVALFLS
ncbi:MAG TPA: DUF4149 domain-containing protein [Candidatus Limnocylindria bacterium]